jgi:hypothetical protein
MSDPSTHRSTGRPATTVDDAWRPWSHAWTKQVRTLTGRTDLTVLVAPGAGGGAPECFYPHLRRIEVDATYIADSPDIADPTRATHKRLVPTGVRAARARRRARRAQPLDRCARHAADPRTRRRPARGIPRRSQTAAAPPYGPAVAAAHRHHSARPRHRGGRRRLARRHAGGAAAGPRRRAHRHQQRRP